MNDSRKLLRFSLAAAFVVLCLLGSSVLVRDGAAQEQTPLLVMISVDGMRPDYITAANAHGLRCYRFGRSLVASLFSGHVETGLPAHRKPTRPFTESMSFAES